MKQIDTPEFKRWFGDSKVVDAKGVPLVVYHGTNKSFTTFQTNRPMWFAVNPELASQFSAGGRRSFGSKPVKGSLIMPVFLRITNPLDLTYAHRWVRLSRVELMKEIGVDTSEDSLRELAKRQLASGYVGVGSQIQDPVSYLVGVYQEKDSIYHLLDDPDMVLAMKSKGYDGLMMTESITTGTRSKPILIKSVTYAVFDATQVKSAYGNRGTFDPNDPDIRNPKLKPDSIYTDPAMRERLKRKILAGDRGGRPGEWSARKAQLLAAEYEKSGGGYKGGRTKAQRSLSRWTKQDWQTKSGKPSLETGERYLPAAAIAALSSAEYAATTRAKRSATGQFSRQPRRIARKTREFRNPVSYPKEDITYAALTPTPANKDIAGGKALLETPEFKKWFGESKVRDLAKRPMVVYHGTCSSGFTKFDPTKTREMGFHFGTPPQAKDFLKGCGTSRGSRPGIYPVYLSIQNPIFTPDVYSDDPTYFIEWLERTNHIHEWFPDEDDSYYRSLNKLRSKLVEAKLLPGSEGYKTRQPIYKATWGLLRKVVTRKGYDGIRYKNENEGNTDDPYNMAWIAFSPAQIKSATDNVGTFNRRDPDIRNPMDPSSAFTQIAGTKGTYAEAAKMIGGKVIDYGAGYGLGTDVMRDAGLSVDSYEPFPMKWKGKRPPTFTRSEKIPDASYDSLVSFSVVNVVQPDERKKIFRDVARLLRPGGVALITGRTPEDVEKAKTKVPYLEKGGYMIDQGVRRRYQKGFTQSELEQYAKEMLGPGFKVERNAALNGASIKVTKVGKAKSNPVVNNPIPSMVRSKLSRIIEPGDRILCYDRAQGEDLYRLWDMVHTAGPLTKEALVEIEGMLDDDGVLVIESGEEPPGLRDHFRKVIRYGGMLLVQGPMNPEEARINTEKLRREME